MNDSDLRRGHATLNETIIRVWRKSSYSGNENACLEILTPPPGQAPVRDSKDPDDSVIVFQIGRMAGLHSRSPARGVSDLGTSLFGAGLQVRTVPGVRVGGTGRSSLGGAPGAFDDHPCLGCSEDFIAGVQSQASWPVTGFRRGAGTVG
ncbi:hypothetical protein GCM10020295_36450 [Streptomyces cinereospinus]